MEDTCSMFNFTASSLIGYLEQTSRKPFHGSLVSTLDHLMESCIIRIIIIFIVNIIISTSM